MWWTGVNTHYLASILTNSWIIDPLYFFLIQTSSCDNINGDIDDMLAQAYSETPDENEAISAFWRMIENIEGW